MKKVFSFITILTLCVAILPTEIQADNKIDNTYISQLSAMVQKYDTDDYFSTMSVTIGESNLVIDGEEIPIDESGSVAYVENGRTMMPVRGIAEAVGADVDYDDKTQTVTVENKDTKIAMTIGESEMQVNGQSVQLLTAPEIKEDRTMLPVRDVAEALNCEVEWDGDSQTAIFTRDYQSKRVIVQSENANTEGAVETIIASGKTVAQFDSIDVAKACVSTNKENGLVAEPDYIRTLQSLSWGADMIGGASYHNQTSYVGGSAIVAVIDTGIDYNHEMFKGRIYGGYDIYNNDDYCEDTIEHGTHVASTIVDIAGSNTNIKIMPLKVFGTEDSTPSSIVAEAIKYASDNGADVINLSLGGEGYSYDEQEAINYANMRNVAVVAAAGNEKLNLENCDFSPGGLDGVITVSAMTSNGNLASYSNYGEGVVEFTAPGSSINGAKVGGGYCKKSGTSMATPHVAAVYALSKAVHPDMTTNEITVALQKNATNKNNKRYFGAGVIKADSLERCISSMFYSNLEIESITDSNVIISASVGYSGLIPKTIGIKINDTEIYSTQYKDNGDKEMLFKCDLANDAKFSLKAGTTYEAKIFTNQGEYILNTDIIKFTTGGTAIEPAPPTPSPGKSELKILPENYPQGEINQGSKFNLSGRIKSDKHITDVRSYILDENKNVIQEASGWTTTQTYVIEGSKLDIGLNFEQLSPGNYYLKYYANDESGNYVEWTSDSFMVKGQNNDSPIEPVENAVVLIPNEFENLSIRNGPSTNHKIIGSMNHTDKCKVYTDKTQNGWYYVEFNGIKGYAAGNYIYLPSETKIGTVSIPSSWDNLSIRTGPSTDYKIIGSMDDGVKCTVYLDKTKNGWYYVGYNEVYGYASGSQINIR